MWELFSFRVTDGLLGPKIEAASWQWSREIRDSSMQSVTIPRSALDGLQAHQVLMPWRMGLLLCWDGAPWCAGPITARTDTMVDVQATVGGVTDILAGRPVVPWVDVAQAATLGARAPLTWTGLSLGTIAARVVAQAMTGPGARLPITLPPNQTAPADVDHTRTYKPFDLANLACADVLTQIAGVTGGPDISFRPKMVDAQHVGWDMVVGTDADPHLPQNRQAQWTVGAPGGEIKDFTQVIDPSKMATRVYMVGSGTDSTTLIRAAEDQSLLGDRWPRLDRVVSESGTEGDQAALLQSHAQAQLDTYRLPQGQWEMTVQSDDAEPLGSYWPGEEVQVTVKNHPTILDGDYLVRILSMTGDQTPFTTLKFDTVEVPL